MPVHSTTFNCVCRSCNKLFHTPQCHIASGRGIYCSIQCRVFGNRKTLAERFTKHLSAPNNNGCILWTGATHKDGYGIIYSGNKSPRVLLAHRVAYLIANGELDQSMNICHSCDVPLCVNINHLFIGTQLDNIADCIAKGRHSSKKLSEESVKQIRLRRDEVEKNCAAIGREFGVSSTTIRNIISRKTWKHLP